MDKNSQIKSAFTYTMLSRSGLGWLKDPKQLQSSSLSVFDIRGRSQNLKIPSENLMLPSWSKRYPPGLALWWSTLHNVPMPTTGPTLHCWSTPWTVIPASQCLPMIRVCVALGFWGNQFFGWIYAEPFWDCRKVVFWAKWRPNVNKIYSCGKREDVVGGQFGLCTVQ